MLTPACLVGEATVPERIRHYRHFDIASSWEWLLDFINSLAVAFRCTRPMAGPRGQDPQPPA